MEWIISLYDLHTPAFAGGISGTKLVLYGIVWDPYWLMPPSSLCGMLLCRHFPTRPSLLMSYGVEGYLMDAAMCAWVSSPCSSLLSGLFSLSSQGLPVPTGATAL